MRSLFAALILVGSSLALAGCDNGNNDSTSGGGSNLSLSGTWFVNPDVRPKNGRETKPYFATLSQSGKSVVSSTIFYDPDRTNGSCDKGVTARITGTASGNTFTGQYVGSVSAVPYSTGTFTVTGTSNSLAGSYRITYNSGACVGARTGTVTMKRN